MGCGVVNISTKMPMPVSAEDYQNVGEYFTFSPVSIERYHQQNILHQQQQQQQYPRATTALNPGNSNTSPHFGKRKFDELESVDNFDPRGYHVSQTLTPPQTPAGHPHVYQRSACLDTSYPGYQQQSSPQDFGHVSKVRRITTGHQQQNEQQHYQMVSVNGVGFQIKYPSDLDNINSNGNNSGNKNINNPGINFLYEKSLNNAQRWRENGLTVQLFYCIVCQFPCDDDGTMKSHIESLHGNIVAGGHLHCSPCSQMFYSEDTFLQHSASHYQSSTDCKGCGGGFTSKESLRKHEEHCNQCRPYRCEYCDRGFILIARLKHHRRNCLSAPEPPKFICKVCNKQFTDKGKYFEHVPVHAFM